MNEDLSKYSYEKALQEVLRVRAEHQQRKGDSWREMKDWQLLAKLKAKIHKVEEAILCNCGNLDGMGATKESLIGIVNYALFLLQNDIERMEDIEEVEKPKRKYARRRKVRKVRKARKVRTKKVEKPKRKYTKRKDKGDTKRAPKRTPIQKIVEAEENGTLQKSDFS